MEKEWKGIGKNANIIWNSNQMKWRGIRTEMEWKIDNRKSTQEMEWRCNGNRMEMEWKK